MALRALLAVALLAALPYAGVPVYRFPDPAPFSGSHLLNPYEGLTGRWHRANFHAHGRAWGGLTSGAQPSDEVARAYRSLGYQVPGISNYHSIAAHHGVDTLPIYEHGYNLNKRHQLAIGARRVEWFDLLLWQSLSHQQFIIDRVGASADLIALAHPLTRDAYDATGMRYLTGYQLVEVINGGHSSESSWDAALSSGRAVWALANDDTHDLSDTQRMAVSWNMIDAPSAAHGDVVAALRAGRSVATVRTGKPASGQHLLLTGAEVRDATLFVSVSGTPSKFIFIGQNGAVRKVVDDVLEAHYTFRADDTYVRAVVAGDETSLLLNPVIRFDGRAVPHAVAVVDPARTWMMRVASALAAGAAAWYLFRRRRPTVKAGADSQVSDRRKRKTA